MIRSTLGYSLATLVLGALPAQALPGVQDPGNTIAAFTEGMNSQDGFLPVHLDPDSGKIFLEIERLDEDVLYLNTLATGLGVSGAGLDAGTVGNEAVVRFERRGPRVQMVRQNVGFVASSGDAAAVQRVAESFPVSVLASFPIVASEGSRLLVDATELILSDAWDVRGRVKQAELGELSLDSERSYAFEEFTKAFPQNTEIRAVLTFVTDDPHPELRRHAPDGRAITLQQHHSFVELPKEPLQPRVYDPRTGNSAVALADYSQGLDDEYRLRSTRRWRLEPSDPEAYARGELVEPVEPIIYYLDPAIPEPYRSAYREGATWWNEVFEAAGFRNAFRVEDLPEGADRMDARYSVIQLTHRSGAGPSNGGAVQDPRSGEILKALPRMDSHRSLVDYHIFAGLLPAYDALGIEPQIDGEAFAMARRRQHIAHEVGHTLGLPHNHMGAAQGRSSVMDYPFPLIRLDEQGRLDISEAYRPGPGYGDSLAIRYAYTYFPDPEGEAEGLEAIVQEALDRGFRFVTGGHAGLPSSFPEAHLWVEGSTMFEALERSVAVRRLLLQHFDERAIRPGEPMAWLNQRLAHVYLHHRYSVEAALKNVGGMEFSYALRGDGQTPTRVIPAADQRRALDAVLAVLSPEELAVPDHIPDLIPPVPSGFETLEPWVDSPAGTALDPLAIARSFAQEVVDNLLHRERLARVASFHARDPEQLSLDEVLRRLVDGTWRAPGPRSPREGPYRRVAERAVLDALFALAADEDATAEVRDAAHSHLTMLGRQLEETRMAFAGGTDDDAQGGAAEDLAHRIRAHSEIERFLTDGEIPPLRTGVIQIPLPWP